jgi:hypothetical protein
MTRWRKRLGEAGEEAMLKATIDSHVVSSAGCLLLVHVHMASFNCMRGDQPAHLSQLRI